MRIGNLRLASLSDSMFTERKKQKTTDEESVRRDEGILLGFHALTHALTTGNGHFSVVFNRFQELAAWSLTHLQSELPYLETVLKGMDDVDTVLIGDREELVRRKNLFAIRKLPKRQ
jgi:hypothetical protein